jgi:uncharacterized protein (TIGR02246 family)
VSCPLLGLTAWLSYLAKAHAEVRQFEDAWRCIDEAFAVVDTTKERWWEAEVNRIAGEIALRSPDPNAAKAEAYFARALTVARQQQAKSWELRAAMSLARLWRDQGKVQQARELLAPVLRMVYRGPQYARSEGSEGVAGGAGSVRHCPSSANAFPPRALPVQMFRSRGDDMAWSRVIARTLLAVAVVLPALGAVASADPKDEISAATSQWGQALDEDDPDKVLPFYADDAVLWGTLSPMVRADRAALRNYFVTAFRVLPRLKVTFGDQFIRVYGNAAVNTGYYTFSYSKDGEVKTLPARYSFTYVRNRERWLIVDHHSSAMPAAPK